MGNRTRRCTHTLAIASSLMPPGPLRRTRQSLGQFVVDLRDDVWDTEQTGLWALGLLCSQKARKTHESALCTCIEVCTDRAMRSAHFFCCAHLDALLPFDPTRLTFCRCSCAPLPQTARARLFAYVSAPVMCNAAPSVAAVAPKLLSDWPSQSVCNLDMSEIASRKLGSTMSGVYRWEDSTPRICSFNSAASGSLAWITNDRAGSLERPFQVDMGWSARTYS